MKPGLILAWLAVGAHVVGHWVFIERDPYGYQESAGLSFIVSAVLLWIPWFFILLRLTFGKRFSLRAYVLLFVAPLFAALGSLAEPDPWTFVPTLDTDQSYLAWFSRIGVLITAGLAALVAREWELAAEDQKQSAPENGI